MPAMDSDEATLRAVAARLFPGSGRLRLRRVTTGGSTPVYRLRRGDVVRYLRLAERPAASLAPEALAHALLRARGARVPEVVAFEPFDPALGRSLMLTTEIPGHSLAERHHGVDVAAVAAEAGRDLAIIAGVAVDGFGWVCRDQPRATRLTAERPTLRAFARDDREAHLARLATLLSAAEAQAIRQVVARHAAWFDADQAVLAHGDFDATHIYHQDGVYTGLIDFGEIRGADAFYDLGHAALHEGEALAAPLLPSLLAGYGQVAPLPADHATRIDLWALLIGARALARAADRPWSAYQDHLVRAIRQALTTLARGF